MLTGNEIARRAREQLAELTGLKPDTVSGLKKEADGWHVTLEMIEMKRIPDTGDMLGTYSALLDGEGNLTDYRRTRRYLRGETMTEE